ncbi:peptide ABC transporter substrate-binding protein [Brevibacillus fluminis]|uniref:Peptide ABC transporter substrate-binding protein n=1 Tax=Brevibacillus fluminis TaxID=511487 RepID=A0A3M8DV50_9BACL|nr:peptide ABC transporter substrate-binding protein [Brevibacillus fluminis]RNB91365.1 peptide ABC transporter substrate-binding protein [Brevibacillus fluminis]
MKKVLKILGTTALLASLALAGCSQPQATDKPAEQAKPEGQKAAADGKAFLRANLKTEPVSLDPPKAYDPVAFEVLYNVLEGLVRLDENHVPQPAMAEKWDISDGGKTYTFKLRDSKWSNGDPVTAKDFEVAWKRMVDPKNGFPAAFLAFVIDGAEKFNKGEGTADDVKVKALDDKTLQVTLKAPTGYFLSLVATPVFYPVNKKNVEANPNWSAEAATIVSNGPFTLTEWTHDQSVKAVKNENYWDKDKVKLAGINWVMVNDENTQFQMFQSGELDNIESVPKDVKGKLLDSGEAKIAPEAATSFYRLNTVMPPFTNKNVRKAFALAVNRQLLIDKVIQGRQVPAMGIVPIGFPQPDGKDFRAAGGDFFKDNDVEQAKALLAQGMKEEGWTTLPDVTLTYDTNDLNKTVAQVLQEMFKKNLGVEVKLESKEWKVFLAEQRASKHQVSLSTYYADYADPLNFIEIFQTGHPGNRINYSNKAYDQLIQQASVEPDESKRFTLMHEAEKMFFDDMPVLPLYYSTKVYMEQPNVKGILRHPAALMDYKSVEIAPK